MVERIPYAPLIEIGTEKSWGELYQIEDYYSKTDWHYRIDGCSGGFICRSRIDCIRTALEDLFKEYSYVYEKMLEVHLGDGNFSALKKLIYLKGVFAGIKHQRKRDTRVVNNCIKQLDCFRG